jgi:tetratricopeptide (TPR) repeat protein
MAQGGDKQDLLSELLPIQDAAQTDSARLKIAHLFVVAGSPERASDMYRAILRQNPRDAAAYVGLADATLVMGNFSTAHDHLEAAQKIAPDDSVIRNRIALTDTVIAMDPGQRGLTIDEQLRRSRALVQRTITAARKCLDAQSPEVAGALDSVTRSLVASAANVPRAQAIEENLSIAGTLWRMRGTRCAAQDRPDEEARFRKKSRNSRDAQKMREPAHERTEGNALSCAVILVFAAQVEMIDAQRHVGTDCVVEPTPSRIELGIGEGWRTRCPLNSSQVSDQRTVKPKVH